ncbi:hypothetical protein OH76DRAFT_1442743 [Lentinus brumalis]|uniref:Amidohydrolase-related domain-containing protein n=1 Tax=Lentinus brumalis TaxID=2498619 RepID=A0A371D2Q4_9APHY|nr:hypothetical protein OH76DRAFT_1442743 [Polyporus brumalis]
MASYPQHASPFCARLPPDVILAVAFHLATVEPLGPPRHLPALLLTCRYIADILDTHRKALYARIFRATYDTGAALRRLGHTTLTNSALAFQLVKQTRALKRLRHGSLDSDNLLSDLWTAYLMFLENDGRNYRHLIHYARVDSLVDRFMETRLWARRMHAGTGWPLDITPNALVVWMLWFTMTPERLQAMVPDQRTRFMDLLRPFAIAPLQYSPFYAPDNHFDFPIHGSLRDNNQFPEGSAFANFPQYREPSMVMERVIHYGQQLTIMSPSVGLGGKLTFLMLAEAVPYDPPSVLPIDRLHADPADGVRPTQADFIEWASIRGVQLYEPSPDAHPSEEQRLEDACSGHKQLVSASSRFDNDWNRLTGCVDPYRDLPPKGVVYTFGSIAGMFAGRMQIPEFFKYRDLINAPNMPELADFPSLAEVPVYVLFREHHCVSPTVPVPTGGTRPGFDDGVLNAYLPKTFDCQHVGNQLRITIPGVLNQPARYEDYVEGKPSPHDPSKCRACMMHAYREEVELRERVAARTKAAEMELDETDDVVEDDEDEAMGDDSAHRERRDSAASQGSHFSYFYGDLNDPENVLRSRDMMLEHDPDTEALLEEMMSDGLSDYYEDDPFTRDCTGVQDIIITGETLPRHGEAWHHYRFYGRVRQWDGLIVLVRVPTHFPGAGKTIFRGYVVGNRNFVGSWRSYADNIEAIPVEGPFALSRIEERAASSAAAPRLPAPASTDAPAPVESFRTVHVAQSTSRSPKSRSRGVSGHKFKLICLLKASPSLSPSMHIPPGPQITQTNMDTGANAKVDMAARSDGNMNMNMNASRNVGVDGERLVKIYAGKLFDPDTLQLLPQRVVTVSQDSGLILDVRPYAGDEAQDVDFAGEDAVDLRAATVLPGLVDLHVHMFLHAYAERSWDDQLTQETLVERTVRATVHARRTLMAGYTAVRDLGTEGAEDADLQLRKCLSGPNPLIPGPRYFCANRAIITSGTYGPKSSLHPHQDGVEDVTGAQFADGEAECIKAVRKQVGAGADWIKVYADYRPRGRMADVNKKIPAVSIQTFSSSELRTLTSTARQLGVKVAAHAMTWRAELLPENGGFNTIEHGTDIPDELVESVAKSNVIWIPTLSVIYATDTAKAPGGRWDATARNFQKALQKGVTNIACGGDTGPFPHGDNALEMKLMVQLGADWRLVLRWATLGGWQAIRSMAWEGREGAERLARVAELQEDARAVGDNEVPFGAIRRGFAADIVATSGDLEDDFASAVDKSSIVFVMKGGKVFKRDGRETV